MYCQSVQPWLSSRDIPLGASWYVKTLRILEEAEAGIVCLTRQNLQAQWLNFEAGFLSKQAAPVCLYALDLDASEITGPISQFQYARAEKQSTLALVKMLNGLAGKASISEERINRIFELNWPRLGERLESIAGFQAEGGKPPHSFDEKLDEALSLLRSLADSRGAVAAPVSQVLRNSDGEKARPRVFIGSSTEGLNIAHAIQVDLDSVAETTIWNQGFFVPSSNIIDTIVDRAREFDFAILVLTPDDIIVSRGESTPGARDNILFELGLFTGVLGRGRTFMVLCRDSEVKLPSDLSGVNYTTYSLRTDGNLQAAVVRYALKSSALWV